MSFSILTLFLETNIQISIFIYSKIIILIFIQ